MSLAIEHFYRFGEFTVDCDQRILLRRGKPLPLTPKVFDTLLMLVENRARIVTKDELMNRIWPESFVVEANLTFNIQQIRKSLGDNARRPLYVETVARRGYRFIAKVDEIINDGARFAAAVPTNGQSVAGDLLASETTPAQPQLPRARVRVSEFARPTFGFRQGAVVLLVMLLLGGVFALWKFRGGSKAALLERGNPVVGSSISAVRLERLTQTGQNRMAAISPDGKFVAYTRVFEGKAGIWLKQLNSDTNVELVPATYIVGGPVFANSGEYLYFVKGRPSALYRIPLIGGSPRKIVDNLEGIFSISPDDHRIVFIRQSVNHEGQRQFSLMLIDADGGNERALLVRSHPDDLDVPLWKPDGLSVICSYGNSSGGNQNVRIVELRIADQKLTDFAPERFFYISKMAWLPNQRGLIISGRMNDQDINQLWRLALPGLELRQITDALDPFLDLSLSADAGKAIATQAMRVSDIWVGPAAEPRNLKRITQALGEFCWTPDGRLVYAATTGMTRDLWIMRPDGTEQRQLTANAGWNGTPVVSADNHYIVFTSNRSGSRQVWRMEIDGSNQIQLTNGLTTTYPAISTDGRWVFYNTTDDWRVWRISINGGQPSRLTSYVALHPTVSPDGQKLACVGRDESRSSLLVLPVEGGQPLQRFAFNGWGSRVEWSADGKSLIYDTDEDMTRIVRQPLAGGPLEKILDIEGGYFFDFGFSWDGRSLAVTRGGWQHDIVLISGLDHF